jgi:amino acid adenylation domain-containing protein
LFPSHALIDEFVERSRLLDGQEIVERAAWNTRASTDAIRHFAYGTSDDNPLWLNEDYARRTVHGGLIAPPAFLCSVLYPFLHGAPMEVPLSSLIGKVSMEWFHPIREGDWLRASARQTGVTDTLDRRGHRLVLIDAETRYWNQHDALVGIAQGTMARIARAENELLLRRDIYRYNNAERAALRCAFDAETRRGAATRTAGDVWVGQLLPVFMRGPLAIGDLVCWQAAIGPSYRAGSLGYRDMVEAPHHVALNPVTGWPVKYSQQHEDFLMAAQRGLPAPFDNSLMRFAWLVPMLTNWMGDEGVLARLSVQTDAPILYGDTVWYRGVVTHLRPAADRGIAAVIRISGVNQLGETTTSGEAEVILPARQSRAQSLPRVEIEPSVLDRLSEQVNAKSDNPAIRSGEQTITFAQLDRRSTAAAHRLSAFSAGSTAPIAVALERSADAAVVIFAILKTGSAYLPIDVNLPAESLEATLAAARPALLIAPKAALPALPRSLSDCRSVALEEVLQDGTHCEGPSSRAIARGDALAYIMPTSGTTGAARLVGVSHGSLARYVRALSDAIPLTSEDVYVHTAAFTFSASVRQLFYPLCMGVSVVIAQEEQRRYPPALWQLVRNRGVTVWDTVPSVWRTCMDNFVLLQGDAAFAVRNDRLRLIVTTGEALPWELPFRWQQELGHPARMMNLYSQTETAGTVCCHEIPSEVRERTGFVPLGQPLAFTQVTLVDERGKTVADGEVGELCVTGSRLASGYVGDGALTAQRFQHTPFQHDGFYRTGDLARRNADGVLEFVGRRDRRVKIRGQRVVLDEVEVALRSIRSVKDSVVVVDEGETANARLLAYVVTDGECSGNEILPQLRSMLSDAALPAAVLPITAVPRNAAGKVDRAALPTLQEGRCAAIDDANGLCNRVAHFFAEALDLKRVDTADSFFDLGGNSLLATTLITRLRMTFGVPLPISRFFAEPTAAAVAAAIEDLLLQEIEQLSEEEAARLLDPDAI